jgi:hypothetical protein
MPSVAKSVYNKLNEVCVKTMNLCLALFSSVKVDQLTFLSCSNGTGEDFGEMTLGAEKWL